MKKNNNIKNNINHNIISSYNKNQFFEESDYGYSEISEGEQSENNKFLIIV